MTRGIVRRLTWRGGKLGGELRATVLDSVGDLHEVRVASTHGSLEVGALVDWVGGEVVRIVAHAKRADFH